VYSYFVKALTLQVPDHDQPGLAPELGAVFKAQIYKSEVSIASLSLIWYAPKTDNIYPYS